MLDERVAVLEAQVQTLANQNREILDKLDEINKILSRQKGFVGGVVFIITAIIGAVSFGVELFRK